MSGPYSKEYLEQLVSCEKQVKLLPKADMILERGSYRNDMSLVSVDKELEFRVFIRRNEDFPENFSLGIIFIPSDGTSFCLLR